LVFLLTYNVSWKKKQKKRGITTGSSKSRPS